MERLTKRLPSGAADYNYPKSCYFGDGSGADRISQSAFRQRCVEQLADYEDMKLTPEEIDMDHEAAEQLRHLCQNCDLDRLEKLAEAEQDGKLVVIPWAAGDVIYEADPAHGVVKHTFAGEPAWMMHSYAVDDAGNEWYDGWGSSDETPFYKTREEAEAVLKGGEG